LDSKIFFNRTRTQQLTYW